METWKDLVIKPRSYSCLCQNHKTTRVYVVSCQDFPHYIVCSLPTALNFISFSVRFCLSQWKHKLFKGWNVEVSWKRDKGESFRHPANFFTSTIYSTQYIIPINISPYFADKNLRLRKIILVGQTYSDGKMESLDTLGKWEITGLGFSLFSKNAYPFIYSTLMFLRNVLWNYIFLKA